MYIGFSENCDCLLTVSSTGRGLWDLSNGERIERFYEKDCEGLNEKNLICRGIGFLSDEIIRVAGLCGGGLIRVSDKGEMLELVSPLYPYHYIVFNADWRRGAYQERVIIHKGFVRHFGFSYSQDYFVNCRRGYSCVGKRKVAYTVV